MSPTRPEQLPDLILADPVPSGPLRHQDAPGVRSTAPETDFAAGPSIGYPNPPFDPPEANVAHAAASLATSEALQ